MSKNNQQFINIFPNAYFDNDNNIFILNQNDVKEGFYNIQTKSQLNIKNFSTIELRWNKNKDKINNEFTGYFGDNNKEEIRFYLYTTDLSTAVTILKQFNK